MTPVGRVGGTGRAGAGHSDRRAARSERSPRTNAAGRVVGSSPLALNAVEPTPATGPRAPSPARRQPRPAGGVTRGDQPLIACAARLAGALPSAPCFTSPPGRPRPRPPCRRVRAGGASAYPGPGRSRGASGGASSGTVGRQHRSRRVTPGRRCHHVEGAGRLVRIPDRTRSRRRSGRRPLDQHRLRRVLSRSTTPGWSGPCS